MSDSNLGLAWTTLETYLRGEVRVLVIDDEEVLQDVLVSVAEACGYQADAVASAEDAERKAAEKKYDLYLVDKNLPRKDGGTFIREQVESGSQVPAILITGYPSAENIDEVLAAGAVDYLSKPFDDLGHIQKRIESVVDQRRAALAVGQILRDLQNIVAKGGADAARVREMGRTVFLAKQRLSARPDVLLIDAREAKASVTAKFFEGADLTTRIAPSPDAALETLHSDEAPVSVLVSLDLPDPVALVERIHQDDPSTEILLTGRAAQLEGALAAIWAGATDFVLVASEGQRVLANRVARASARARRRKLAGQLLGVIYRTTHGDATPDDALRALIEPLETGPSAAAGEKIEYAELDLTGLLDD